MENRTSKPLLIFILGCMTALSPFSIDMYLPAFQSIADQFQTTVAHVSLSVSSYFVGLSFGQLFYGPLLDRFGRKRPLYAGLFLYILASVGCLFSSSTDMLIIWRFVQALGGCVAGVGSMAMVRDLFSLKESAKVYSLLILILGTSPLLAPTIGGFLSSAFGWKFVFLVLAFFGCTLLFVIRFFLTESHQPDPTVSLKPIPIAQDFLQVLKNPQFFFFVISGAIGFSGLFVYIVGSPIIFLQKFQVSSESYGMIFAIVATGMILASQLNVTLLKKFSNRQILFCGVLGQMIVGFLLMLGTWSGHLGLPTTVALLFIFMGFFGITNPNAGALALEPFSANAGRAAALMGFLQMGTGSIASTSIGLLELSEMLPIVTIMALTSTIAFVVLSYGLRILPPPSTQMESSAAAKPLAH